MQARFDTTKYRYPNEQLILAITIILALGVIALTATATVCTSIVFVTFVLVYTYYGGISHHQQLTSQAQLVTSDIAPGLSSVIYECKESLQVEPVDVFVVHHNTPNAYTFGLISPKSIVLYDSLLEAVDRDEIKFIIGHEMGHIKLGHTWLNSLVGGMAGIPASSSASYLLVFALRSWSRACEFSADRAGLLACGNLHKAISALVKVEIGSSGRGISSFQEALAYIDSQDDHLVNNFNELLATHPMVIKRINQLKEFVKTSNYKTLQVGVFQNLV